MQVRIVYVHHNCFLLHAGARTFLFDYPDSSHRPRSAEALVRREAAGRELWIMASHGHADHFTPEIMDLRDAGASVRYVLSYDIAEMHQELDPEFEDAMHGVTIVEPDEKYEVEGLPIACLESTDLGVGFVLDLGGKRVWFGGDVAEWSWEGADERARRFSEEHYAGVLAQLGNKPVDLAFSNADPRMPSWAGGKFFVERIRPRYFVPMHAFGDTRAVARFIAEAATPGVEMFAYQAMGDAWEIEL